MLIRVIDKERKTAKLHTDSIRVHSPTIVIQSKNIEKNQTNFSTTCDNALPKECMQCELCEGWRCLKCSNISTAFQKQIVPSRFCPACDNMLKGLIPDSNLNRIRSYERDNKSCSLLNTNPTNKIGPEHTNLAENLKQPVDSQLMEFITKSIRDETYRFFAYERRKRNVLIYGMESHKIEDIQKITNLFPVLEVEATVEDCFRLRRSPSLNSPNPILVKFTKTLHRREVLKNSQKIKSRTGYTFLSDRICPSILEGEIYTRQMSTQKISFKGRGTPNVHERRIGEIRPMR